MIPWKSKGNVKCVSDAEIECILNREEFLIAGKKESRESGESPFWGTVM